MSSDRFFANPEALRVADRLHLPTEESGVALVYKWVHATTEALVEAIKQCRVNGARTKVIVIDDETYLHDLQPWPPSDAGPTFLCDGKDAARRSRLTNRAGQKPGASYSLSKPLSQARSEWVTVHDDFESEGLLWLLYSMAAALALALCCCAVNTMYLVRADDAEEAEEG